MPSTASVELRRRAVVSVERDDALVAHASR